MNQETTQNGETIVLSERDSLLVLDLLENPPPANAKLKAAIAALADNFERLGRSSDSFSESEADH